jgi:hypothetical protein
MEPVKKLSSVELEYPVAVTEAFRTGGRRAAADALQDMMIA